MAKVCSAFVRAETKSRARRALICLGGCNDNTARFPLVAPLSGWSHPPRERELTLGVREEEAGGQQEGRGRRRGHGERRLRLRAAGAGARFC